MWSRLPPPPPSSLPPGSGVTASAATRMGGGRVAGSDGAAAAAVGSRRGDTLGGRALGRRDGGKQLLAVFFSFGSYAPVFRLLLLLATLHPPLSLVVFFSEAVISFCHAVFFVAFFLFQRDLVLFKTTLLHRSDG